MKRSFRRGRHHRPQTAAWIGLAFGLLLGGCQDSSAGLLRLDNGVTLTMSDSGAIALHRDERELLALPSTAVPVARRFNETWRTGLGIVDFQRADEERLALTKIEAVEAQPDGLILRYATADGALRASLSIRADPGGDTLLTLTADGPVDSLALPLRCDPGGSFHGFGEQYNATDQRGEAFSLIVSEQGTVRHGEPRLINGDAHTTYFPMPAYIDGRGFGVLVETDQRVEVDLCQTDPQVAWFEVVADEALRLRVFFGPTPLAVIGQLGAHLGRPAAPPAWAYDGVWICAQGGREAVLAEVDALEAAAIPVGALWIQDWSGIRQNVDGGFGVEYRWEHDPELYPDLAGLIADLHGRGYKVFAYANPFVDPDLPNHFAEMEAANLLVRQPDGQGTYLFLGPPGNTSHPDLTNPAARDYVKAALKAMILDLGLDGWMTDFGEWLPLDASLHDGSDPRAAHNRYPIAWQELTRQAMAEARPDGDFVMFARSGWTGVQGVAQIHWVGDQDASFDAHDGLPTVVPALLNLGLAGQPYVTHDIAGFSGGPSSKELFLRWTELGAFTPFMRTHEGNDKLNNWSWEKDAETTTHFRRFARVHQALAPEFRALAEAARLDSAPILRHLMLAYPEDPATWPISDQFLIGSGLLVAPVLEEGQTRRSVYLPVGTWYHVWSGEAFAGGRTVEVDAPIGQPPVFSLDVDRADLRAID